MLCVLFQSSWWVVQSWLVFPWNLKKSVLAILGMRYIGSLNRGQKTQTVPVLQYSPYFCQFLGVSSRTLLAQSHREGPPKRWGAHPDPSQLQSHCAEPTTVFPVGMPCCVWNRTVLGRWGKKQKSGVFETELEWGRGEESAMLGCAFYSCHSHCLTCSHLCLSV